MNVLITFNGVTGKPCAVLLRCSQLSIHIVSYAMSHLFSYSQEQHTLSREDGKR